MKTKLFMFVLFAMIQSMLAEASNHTQTKVEEQVNVGMKVLTLLDTQRNAWRSEAARPVATHIFYPTLSENVELLMLGPKQSPYFVAGNIVKKGIPKKGKHPLILMSHGTGGSAPQFLWLAEALVKQGYIVAAVNHHGNTGYESEKYPEGFLLWWERTRDLRFVQRQLLQHSTWTPLINPEKVAVVGFSLGGYTALSALGGITDKAMFDEYCSSAHDDFSCQAQPEFSSVLEAFEEVKNAPYVKLSMSRQHDSFQLPDLKAAIVIAPAIVHAFRPESLLNIDTPTLLVVGDKDAIAPNEPNTGYAHSLLPNSEMFTISKAHHYSFLSNCTPDGRVSLSFLCSDPHGVTREEVHKLAIAKALSFLQEHLD